MGEPTAPSETPLFLSPQNLYSQPRTQMLCFHQRQQKIFTLRTPLTTAKITSVFVKIIVFELCYAQRENGEPLPSSRVWAFFCRSYKETKWTGTTRATVRISFLLIAFVV